MADEGSKRTNWRLGCLIVFLMCLLAYLNSQMTQQDCRDLRRTGLHEDARIVERSTGRDYSEGGGTIFFITYEYTVNGVTYRRRVENNSLYRVFAPNMPVSIVYDPDNPGESLLLSGDGSCGEYR